MMNCTCYVEKSEKKPLALKLAKLIRALTVPPIMVGTLLLILFFCDDVFPSALDFGLSLAFLAIVPSLAYVAQKLLPAWREGGQKAQRKLAFVFSFVGYTGAVICSALRGAVPNLLYISLVYLVSVVILTLINCLTPWHASGHGCSLMGPILLTCLFVGWYAVPAGIVVYCASLWASVYMKRHTVREFFLGSLSAILAAFVCYFIVHPIF
ncbi:MAG: hypothetical protein IJX39_10605 [Clostridia bacterium]|nr:hypothetical protein [Clostridia bacterium]